MYGSFELLATCHETNQTWNCKLIYNIRIFRRKKIYTIHSLCSKQIVLCFVMKRIINYLPRMFLNNFFFSFLLKKKKNQVQLVTMVTVWQRRYWQCWNLCRVTWRTCRWTCENWPACWSVLVQRAAWHRAAWHKLSECLKLCFFFGFLKKLFKWCYHTRPNSA